MKHGHNKIPKKLHDINYDLTMTDTKRQAGINRAMH